MQVAGVRLSCEGEQAFSAALRSAASAAKRTDGELKKLTASYGAGSKDADFLARKQQLLTQRLDEQRKRTETLRATRDAYARTQDANPAKLAKLDDAIQQSEVAEAQLQRQLKETTAAMEQQAAAAEKAASAQEKLAGVSKRLETTGEKLSKAGGKLTKTVTTPLVAGLTASAAAAINFESAFVGVQKTVDATDEEYAGLKRTLLDMSERLPSTAVDLAGLMEIAGQLGVDKGDLAAFTEVIANLGVATNLSGEEAATMLAQYANIMGMDLSQVDKLGSVIVALGNNCSTTEKDITEMAQRLAGTGALIGLDNAQVMALSATMASLGVSAEAGGTAMSKTLQAMNTAVLSGGGGLKAFAKTAGISAKEFAAQWKGDPLTALQSFLTGLNAINASGGDAAGALKNAGLSDTRMVDTLLRMAGAEGSLAKNLNLASAAWAENTALQAEAEKFGNTTASKLAKAKNSIVNAGAALGESMVPYIQQAAGKVQELAQGFAGLDSGTQGMIVKGAALAAAVGPVTKAFGGMLSTAGKLLPMLSGPTGLLVAGVAGFAALGVAIASIDTPLERLDKDLKGIDLQVDEGSVADISSAIQRGIAAADKQYTVELEIQANMDKLRGQVDDVFEDGKLSWKERKTLAAALNDEITSELTEAKALLEKRKQEVRDMLDGLTDGDGQPLYSEEEKNALAEAAVSEVSSAITELEGLKTDLDTLIAEIVRNGGTASEAQLTQMEGILDRIQGLENRISELNNSDLTQGEQSYQAQKTGHGDEETLGESLGYAAQKEAQHANRADTMEETARAERDAALAAGKTEDDYIKAEKAYNKAMESVNKERQAGVDERNEIISGSWEGLAKGNEDGAKVLQEAGDLLKAGTLAAAWLNEDDDTAAAALRKQLFSDENIQKFFPGAAAMGLTADNLDTAGLPLAAYAEQFYTSMGEALSQVLEGNEDELSPFTSALQAMLDQGFDPESVDWTTMDGTLRSAMMLHLLSDDENGGTGALESGLSQKIATAMQQAMDLAGANLTPPDMDTAPWTGAAGEDIAAAIRAGEPLSTAQAEALRQALAATLSSGSADGGAWQTAAGSIGSAITAGGASAIAAAWVLRRQIEAILSGTNTSIIVPGMGGGPSLETGGGPVNPNISSDVNVFVENANLGSRQNVESFAAELWALNRSKLAGLGGL